MAGDRDERAEGAAKPGQRERPPRDAPRAAASRLAFVPAIACAGHEVEDEEQRRHEQDTGRAHVGDSSQPELRELGERRRVHADQLTALHLPSSASTTSL